MGGLAIKESRRLYKPELMRTYAFVKGLIEFNLGLKEGDFKPIGSYCKKKDDDTYGDIDIMIDANKIVQEFTFKNDEEYVGRLYNNLEYVDNIFKRLGYETVVSLGFGQVSVKIPVCGEEDRGFAQVDLMLTEYPEWADFVYFSPDFTKGESRYPSKYMGMLIMAIITEAYKGNYTYNENGQLVEYSMLAYRLNEGIMQVRKSHQGVKGLIKVAKIVNETLVTVDPKEVMALCFGDKYRDKPRVKSFEETWKRMHSSFFIHKDKLDIIVDKYKHYLTSGKHEWPQELKEDGTIRKKLNTHMPHIEELFFEKNGINLIRDIFDGLDSRLRGRESDIKVSVKIDGAPAMFAWSSFPGLPDNGVGTKTVFNKQPITCHTDLDIDISFGDRPNLAHSLKLLLKNLKGINIPYDEMWQGDFLFDETSLVDEGEQYSFRPNTIKYFVDKGKIGDATFGIVWHTRYTGDITCPEAHFDADIMKLGSVGGVYQVDPYIEDIATGNREDFLHSLLRNVEVTMGRLNVIGYKEILEYKTFNVLFQKYHNYLIRSGLMPNNLFDTAFVMFCEKEKGSFVADKITAIIMTNSSAINILNNLIQNFAPIKRIINQKLNEFAEYKSFVELKNGELKEIAQEGFAISTPNGDVVKIVDRTEFAFMNFSDDVVKGWQHE